MSKNSNYLVYIVYDSDAIGEGSEGFPGQVTLFKSKQAAKDYRRGFRYDSDGIELENCYKIITDHKRLDKLIADLKEPSNDGSDDSADSDDGSEAEDMDDDVNIKGLWVVCLHEIDDEKDHKIDYENEFEAFSSQADAEYYAEQRRKTLSKKLKNLPIMCNYIEICSDKEAEEYYNIHKREHEAKKSSSSGKHHSSSSSSSSSSGKHHSSSSSSSSGSKKHK
jgi:hypothetical protein